MLYLSGWASTPKVWSYHEEFFSQFRFINGHYYKGLDGITINDKGPSSYGEATFQLIKEERDPLILVGWSLGAMVALELALFAPEKVGGLVLVGGTSRFTNVGDYDAGLPRVVVERMKKKMTRNHVGTLADFQSLMFTAKEREAGFPKRYHQVLTSEVPWSERELMTGLNYLLEQDLREKLKDIRVPTLVIHGDRDEICPVKAGLYLHEGIQDSAFKRLPNCGHVPFISSAQDYYEAIERWLNERF